MRNLVLAKKAGNVEMQAIMMAVFISMMLELVAFISTTTTRFGSRIEIEGLKDLEGLRKDIVRELSVGGLNPEYVRGTVLPTKVN